MKDIEWALNRIREVQANLREPQRGTTPDFQADRLEDAAEVLEKFVADPQKWMRGPQPDSQDGPKPIQGGGTGNQ